MVACVSAARASREQLRERASQVRRHEILSDSHFRELGAQRPQLPLDIGDRPPRRASARGQPEHRHPHDGSTAALSGVM